MAGLKGTLDPLSPRERSALMAKVKGKGNRSTELRVAERLTRDGLQGWQQHPAEILGKPDFYFPSLKFAVFVDGCFWHGCPICQRNTPRTRTEFWKSKIESNRARDRTVNKGLKSQGINVLRLWEHEVTADTWHSKFKRRLNRLRRQRMIEESVGPALVSATSPAGRPE